MVLVAIPSGTSPTAGRSIISAILATEKHQVIIISRTPSSLPLPPQTHKYNAPIHHVDYASPSSLKSALSGVHTIISVLKTIDPQLMLSYYTNLLHAVIEAHTVRRFAASDWNLGPKSHASAVLPAHQSDLLRTCQQTVREAKSEIEL
jgi:uncharacterized protein YbjT (DUF2867 family)